VAGAAAAALHWPSLPPVLTTHCYQGHHCAHLYHTQSVTSQSLRPGQGFGWSWGGLQAIATAATQLQPYRIHLFTPKALRPTGDGARFPWCPYIPGAGREAWMGGV
jgi:hypothetical protein